ncbi:hypothetical protein FACS1894176_03070 [Bacteroidia bacterium]|nr:hypothetical protein FACS1894176_03070 [Bacteroidia bacterium]
MKKDPFKGAEYKYNYLNLPDEITVPAIMGKINYQYTTSGQKLKASYEWCPSYSLNPVENTGKPTTCTLSTKITDYVGNVIYENNNLKRILTDNGYIEGGVYYFYLKDHLGNNAVLANANGQSQQYNFYYPYGMTSQNESWNLNKQPYKFGGKEYETMHGLNLLDFVARPYDPVTGRFLTPDPLAEKYPWLSTYAYCLNNPVRYVDPDGRTVYFYTLNANGDAYNQVTFDQLDQATKEMVYGWASSKSGQEFLSNFVDGEQTFSLDDNNSLSIKGNGSNFDVRYRFGESHWTLDRKTNIRTTTYGKTEWGIKSDKLTMTLDVDVKTQNFEDQVMTFGHENIVHAQNDIDYINKNYPQGVGLNENNVGQLNSNGVRDHTNYMNTGSREYRNMRNYYFLMRGWLGGTSLTTPERLRKAFSREILNNRQNVTGK